MKKLSVAWVCAGVAILSCLATQPVMAQGQGAPGGGGRGNFDPAQMQQRMMERYREQFGVKSDDEWKIIEARITKVTEARREVGFGGMGRMMRPPGQGGQGGPAAGNQGNAQNRRRGFGAEPSVAETELQTAIEGNASADSIKAKLAKVREERKAKQAALEKAQEELKQVLTVKQEAVAFLNGLCN